MQIGNNRHLAYCTNIHPAHNWEQVKEMLESQVMMVRAGLLESGQLSSEAPYAIGLRLSELSSRELLEGDELALFKEWLSENNAYVFTINGFPYGDFHGARIKEEVYRPDWSTAERLQYTNRLFTILDSLLDLAPGGTQGSVSSLPGSFKSFGIDELGLERIFENLYQCKGHIEDLSSQSGHSLHLGLEPEPFGLFETTGETLKFFAWLVEKYPQDDSLLKLIGVNYDCCHLAVEFEEAKGALERLSGAGLLLSKVHLSNALSLAINEENAELLEPFSEHTYLHQTICQSQDPEQPLRRFVDLPLALQNYQKNPAAYAGEQWRVHYHVPLRSWKEGSELSQEKEGLCDTADHLAQAVDYLNGRPDLCAHFEIETYTWSVMPDELRAQSVTEQICGEYDCALELLNFTN